MLPNQLKSSKKPAYLFIGSGFSRRYMGLETWDSLLKKFSPKNFSLYTGKSKGDLSLAAKYIAEDVFNEIYNNPESHLDFLSEHDSLISKDSANALKCKISEYLQVSIESRIDAALDSEELKALSKANIDGIITTNWDCLLEHIFPKFATFTGQEELLFKSSYGVGEIYKIHGCCSKPETLILTSDDYDRFSERNAYIAAKLTTIFVEHPVIFIGYSISDKYLINILIEIAKSLGEHRDKLSNNLYLLRRNKGDEEDHTTRTQIPLGDFSIPMTQIVTNNFRSVFEGLSSMERKLPVHILRILREQIFEVTKSSEPEKRVKLVDIDDEDTLSDIEFVAGFAVKEKYEDTISSVGLRGISRDELNRPSFPRHLESLTLGPTRRCHEQVAFPRRVQNRSRQAGH